MFFFSLGGVCSFPGGQGLYREGMLLLLKGNQHRIIMNPDLFVYTFLLALGKNNTDEIYRKVFILMPIMFAILIIIGILLFMAAKITLSKKPLWVNQVTATCIMAIMVLLVCSMSCVNDLPYLRTDGSWTYPSWEHARGAQIFCKFLLWICRCISCVFDVDDLVNI